MSDKGGKGFSLDKGSALKSTASVKGKDDASAKSKKSRKVQFDSEDSLEPRNNISSKSSGKYFVPHTTGGKGDKFGSGGKSTAPKAPPKLELKVEQELPQNAKCLMDSEAVNILQGIQDQMVILSEDPTIKIPIAFDRALQYAKSSTHFTSTQSVRRSLEPLKSHGVTDGEMCMIANICPETVEEVFALVPSLKGKKKELKEPLKNALSEISLLKRVT